MTIYDGYVLTEIAGQTYLLPYGQKIASFQRGLQLNETGAFLWRALSSGKTKEELPALLATHVGAHVHDLPGLEDDIGQFLQQLATLGILAQPRACVHVPSDTVHRFLIGTVLMQLNMDESLIAEEFLPFKSTHTDTLSGEPAPDLTISIQFGLPFCRPVGNVLVHSEDLLIIEAEDCYSLLFLTSPDLVACHIDKEAHFACFYCRSADSKTLREELFHGIRFAFLLRAMDQGLFAVHSASILYQNKAWLFSAPSGTGKSTHATYWQKLCGAVPLNGDLNLLGMKNGVPMAYGLPWCGTSGIFAKETYPLGGIVFLQQGKRDQVIPLSPDRRRLMLSQRMISPTWTKDMLLACLDFCAQADEHILCFLLHCTPTVHAAETCRAAIDETLTR